MRLFTWTLLNLTLFSGFVSAQNTFLVTGTAIPAGLLQQNYGKLPKGIAGYDLNICNITDSKQSIVSSEIYQALAQSNAGLQPIGRQIMLTAILRSQNKSAGAIMTMLLNSVTGVLSILSSSKYGPPAGVVSGTALGAISAQQILTNLKPVLTNDQVEKFETEVLEPALVLDSESCVERTVFAAADTPAAGKHALSFRVR
ncbi:MAG: hypothetical protein JO210_09610 [Acidobacteriaceae bacterium]|nr:hypothetical protein [Acidobacteriaceae bacterium]